MATRSHGFLAAAVFAAALGAVTQQGHASAQVCTVECPSTTTTLPRRTTTTPPTTKPPTTTLPPTTTATTPATTKPPGTTTPATTAPHRSVPPATVPTGTVPTATVPGATTTTATTAPTTTTLPAATSPPTTTTVPNPGLVLNHPSTPPGGPITASGHGCNPASTVTLSVDSTPAGTTVADADGAFSAPLLASNAVGPHTVTAACGLTLQALLDVVLTSHAGPPTSTAAILLILLLIVIAVTRWQLFNR